jgi:hypothetical protein
MIMKLKAEARAEGAVEPVKEKILSMMLICHHCPLQPV